MAFVLSRFRSGTLRTPCEPKDVGYSCDFSKNSPNPRFWYNTYWLDCFSILFMHIRILVWSLLGTYMIGTHLNNFCTWLCMDKLGVVHEN